MTNSGKRKVFLAILGLLILAMVSLSLTEAVAETPKKAASETAKPLDAADKKTLTVDELKAKKEAIARGKKMSINNCMDCHTFDEGGPNRYGPNLFGIVGSQHAARDDFEYSDALKKMKKKIWTPQALDDWLDNPQTYAPGTKMVRGQIVDDQNREDMVEYLKSLK